MNLIEAICRGIHVLAAVCWIGGLYVLIRAVRPVLLKGDNPESNYSLLREIQKKYRVLAGMMLMTLLITGFGNLFFIMYDGSKHTLAWMILLGIKLIFVTILFIIFFMNIYAADSQKKKLQDNSDKPIEKPVFVLPKTALIVGLTIIFLGVLLHTNLVK